MRYKGDREYSKINSAINYAANLKARRGNSFPYMTDALYAELEAKGYDTHSFGRHRYTHSITEAKEVVAKLRSEGNYARIICGTNKIRMTEYMVYFKAKNK